MAWHDGQGLGQETQVATSATREAQRSRPQLSVTFRLLACASLVRMEAWCHKFKLGQCHEGAVVCPPPFKPVIYHGEGRLKSGVSRCLLRRSWAGNNTLVNLELIAGAPQQTTRFARSVARRGRGQGVQGRQNVRRLSPEVQNATCFGPSSLTLPENIGGDQRCTRRVPL